MTWQTLLLKSLAGVQLLEPLQKFACMTVCAGVGEVVANTSFWSNTGWTSGFICWGTVTKDYEMSLLHCDLFILPYTFSITEDKLCFGFSLQELFILFFDCWGFIRGSIPCTVVYFLICCNFIMEYLLVCNKITLQLKHQWRQKMLQNLQSMLQVQDSKPTIVHLKLLPIPSIVKEEEEKKGGLFNDYQKMH